MTAAPFPVRIVTGADARYFAMVGLLTQSLARWLPAAPPPLVCDFGLTPAQRRFFADAGRLVPRPDGVAEGTHPYLAKAALADYLADHREGADVPLLWIDGDMMATGPLEEPLRALIDGMARAGATLAAVPDAEVGDIDAFIARWGVAPFAGAIEAAGIARTRPYLNSGFFLCADPKALDDVRDRCAALVDHPMIDQNAFNLVAWETGRRCGVLNGAVWNVHGRRLAHTVVGEDGAVACDGQRALVLHATSIGGTHHEERSGDLRGPTGALPVTVKLFRTPALAAMQRAFLSDFAATHRDALVAAGCYG